MLEFLGTHDARAKWWFAWPFLALGVCLIVVAVGAWLIFARANGEGPGESAIGNDMRFTDASELTHVRAFKQAYVAANGGLRAIEMLQTIRATGKIESGGQVREFLFIKKRPDKAFMKIELEGFDLTYGVNGDTVWQRVRGDGDEPVYEVKQGDEAAALKATGRFFDPLLDLAAFGKGKISDVRLAAWNGEEVLRVAFTYPGSGVGNLVSYVDYRSLRQVARVRQVAGGRGQVERFADYRSVDGVYEPFVVETRIDGKLKTRVVLENVEPNVGTLDSLFEVPEQTQ